MIRDHRDPTSQPESKQFGTKCDCFIYFLQDNTNAVVLNIFTQFYLAVLISGFHGANHHYKRSYTLLTDEQKTPYTSTEIQVFALD